MRFFRFLILLASTTLILSCRESAGTFTLYRTSTIAQMRLHVATFDATGEASDYNRLNCEMVVKYLTKEPEVPDGYYWCERGRFSEK